MDDTGSTTEMVHKHILVSGKVQGVWYRQSTMEVARSLELKGWVRNLPDGRVEIEVYGKEAGVERLIAWCQDGPPLAEVSSVQVEDANHPDVVPQGFRITH